MRHYFALVFLLIISHYSASAQSAAKSIYFELGGAGLATFNYDMRFQKKEDGLGFKVGAGGYNIDQQRALFFPAGLNYLFGKDGKNYFEVGAGITIVSFKDRYYDINNERPKFTATFGHAFFGYRLQPKNGGFLFRAGLTPIFMRGTFFPYWAGVSFGYKF